VIGGLLEGTAVRTGYPRTALALLLVAGFMGSWMPFFALGRWFEDQDYTMESATLFQPIAGWLLFVAVITSVALLIGGHRRVPEAASD